MSNKETLYADEEYETTDEIVNACSDKKTITSASDDAVTPLYSPVPYENLISSSFDPELEDKSRRKMLKDKYFPEM